MTSRCHRNIRLGEEDAAQPQNASLPWKLLTKSDPCGPVPQVCNGLIRSDLYGNLQINALDGENKRAYCCDREKKRSKRLDRVAVSFITSANEVNVFTRVCLSVNSITQKLLIISLWNLMEWLDIIQGPIRLDYEWPRCQKVKIVFTNNSVENSGA